MPRKKKEIVEKEQETILQEEITYETEDKIKLPISKKIILISKNYLVLEGNESKWGIKDANLHYKVGDLYTE